MKRLALALLLTGCANLTQRAPATRSATMARAQIASPPPAAAPHCRSPRAPAFPDTDAVLAAAPGLIAALDARSDGRKARIAFQARQAAALKACGAK